jgi:hypothetical protein
MELLETCDDTSPRATPFVAGGEGKPPPQLALDLISDGEEPADEWIDPEDDPGDLRIDDLDPDLFGSGNPEDF